MQCEAVYSRNSIAFASFHPEIKLEIQPMSNSGTISIAIFRYEDRVHFTYGTCSNIAVEIALCEKQDLGKFIISKIDPYPYKGPVMNIGYTWSENKTFILNASKPIFQSFIEPGLAPIKSFNYTVPDSGVYCVYIEADDQLPYFEVKMSV